MRVCQHAWKIAWKKRLGVIVFESVLDYTSGVYHYPLGAPLAPVTITMLPVSLFSAYIPSLFRIRINVAILLENWCQRTHQVASNVFHSDAPIVITISSDVSTRTPVKSNSFQIKGLILIAWPSVCLVPVFCHYHMPCEAMPAFEIIMETVWNKQL